MSFRIPDAKLQEIRERADIVQVVGERVTLKKSGARFVGLCPFHQEKSPSFTVHPGMGIFHCFGCGEGGDVFSFVMKLEGRPFVEVAQEVAERFGVQLALRDLSPGELVAERRSKDERAQILQANEQAMEMFHGLLLEDPAARPARDYLAGRGYREDAIRRFRMGYAPAAWDVTVGFFQSRQADMAMVARAGLIQERDRSNGYYDRFRNRLLFPIFGPANEVLGFGGRQLSDDGPKYLNSPESKVFHKGRCLYGLNWASKVARQAGTLLIVEGYFDLIALVQAGVENVVATLGTSLTEDHVRLLRRYVSDVHLLFDSDEAGIRAATRSADLLLEADLSARVVVLPTGDDPDTFIQREGVEAFRARMAAAQPVVEFVIDTAASRTDDTPAAKAKAVEALRPLLAAVKSPVERSLYIARLAGRLRVPEQAVGAVARGVAPAAVAAREVARVSRSAQSILGSAELHLGGLVLAHPELATEAEESAHLIGDPSIKALMARVAAVDAAVLDVTAVVEGVADREIRQRLLRFAFDDVAPPEVARQAMRDIFRGLRDRGLRAQALLLQQELAQAAQRGDQDTLARLANERLELEKKIRGISIN